MSPPSSTALSPIKSRRLEEKSSLQNLNSRLENYVLRVKEMEDAKNNAQRELATIRERMQEEIDVVKTRLNQDLEETRKKLDHEIDQKIRLQVLEQEQHVELVKLRTQVKELSDLKLLNEKFKNELTKEKETSKNAKDTMSLQSTQLSSARRKIKDLERENRSMAASLGDTVKELDHLKQKSDTFDVTRDQEIQKIRKEWTTKHQEALISWKKETEERLATVEKEVRNYFEGVVSSLRSQVDELTSELENTKKELDRTSNDYEESLKVRQSLADKVAQLEREYREDRKKFQADRKVYEQNLEKLRVARVSKEQEFNDLMDVKIALDAEISAYRRILDREETRVGLPTPKSTPNASSHKSPTNNNNRKRKAMDFQNGTNSMHTPASSKKLKRTLIDLDAIKIICLDLEKDRIVFENTSTQAIPLKGWEVRGKSEHQVFRFPDTYIMKAKSITTVLSGKRNKNAKEDLKNKDADSFWTKKFSWNPSGDWAVLFNADGIPVSTLAQGLPNEEVKALEEELRAEQEDAAQAGNTCIVM